jgi:flavin-dependent dehydrogenase
MPKIVVVHDVEDVDKWLSHKAERAGAIASMGATSVVDCVAQDGSKTVAVTADVQDVEAVVAATASPGPELMDAMQRHGVRPPVTIFVEK